MSGIAGFIELDGAVADAVRIQAMLDSMRRRGPDRQHAWTGGNAALGQALLATTPEALAERQPWVHPQSHCVVISDSRLDNRPQLLHALGIDGAADDIGDGALLHAAWQRWGRACADHLRGDFVFAIWDPQRRHLFCARDPMGVRPLYLHHAAGKRLVFASSADAVLAHGGIDRSLDEGRIADFLILETEGVDATCTFYQQVQRVPPAHVLEYESGHMRLHKYWHPLQDQPHGLPTTDDDWIDAQREQLDRAVRLRLRSQHPVGSMLSGGLDSSSVVALAGQHHRQTGAPPFPAFSAINSQDPDCAETAAIHAVLAATHSVGHLVDLKDLGAVSPMLLDWWRDLAEPFDGTMVIVAAVFQAAAGVGLRSLMDGVPADNFYTTAGYDHALVRRGRFLAAWQVKREYLATYDSPRLAALRALLRLPGGLLPPRLNAARQGRVHDRDVASLIRDSLIDPAFAQRIGLGQRYRRYRANMDAHGQTSADGRVQSSLGVAYITAGIERYNRVASHFGVEPRPPFADRDLIAFQARVPWHLRLRHGQRKWILRKAMEGLLPPDVAWRPGKEHLGGQFSRALLGMDRDALTRVAGSPPMRGWLDAPRLRDLVPNVAGANEASADMLLPALLAHWLHRSPE